MVEILAIGAHPDDIEIRVGALLASLRRQGRSIGLLHLTQGEAGTRGTVEQRRAEAEAAAAVLGADFLQLLDLGDGRLRDGESSRQALIAVIRQVRPLALIAPFPSDEHPDHAAAGQLSKAAWYLSGISKAGWVEDTPHRPHSLWFYPSHEVPSPGCVVRVSSEDVQQKMQAVRCYKTQFHDPDSSEPETRISQPGYLDGILARMRYFGSIIGAEYGEPLVTLGPTPIIDFAAQIK